MKKGTNLTPKQRKFCEKYIELGNKQEAYRQSYNAGNMNNNSINSAVKELMRNPLINDYIAEIQEKSQKAFIHTIEDSLKLDYDMIETYNSNVAILRNMKSTKKQIEVAQRVLNYIGVSGFNAAQERIAKKLGYYEKDKPITPPSQTTQVHVYQLPDNGRN